MSVESNVTSMSVSACGPTVPESGETDAPVGNAQSPAVSTCHSRALPPLLVMVTSCGTCWATSCCDSSPDGSTVISGSGWYAAIGKCVSLTGGPSACESSVVSSAEPNSHVPVGPDTSMVMSTD